MTKADLIERIAKSKDAPSGITKKAVEYIVDSVFCEITKSMRKDRKFAFPHFGTFERKLRAARKGSNPRTGKAIRIPARNTVVFRPTASLKASVGGKK